MSESSCGFKSHPRHIMPKPKLPDKNFEWTPELAYAIGLITTDGNLSKDGYHMTMRSSDFRLLKTFKKCLNLSNKIAHSGNERWGKKPSYRVQFGNVQFYRWLLKIGLSPAKTYTISKLKIPDGYFRDFLRGHLDGDGSISTYIDRWNTFKNPKYVYTRLYTRFCSVSKEHMQWLQTRIHDLLGINGCLFEEEDKRPNRVNRWTLKFAKNDSIKLFSWIYYKPDLPCLRRKRVIAKKFI